MIDLLQLTYSEFETFMVTKLQEKKYRALQVWQWVWQKQATNFNIMTNLPHVTRRILDATVKISLPYIISTQSSSDGTKKLLLRLSDNTLIETVLIPSQDRNGVVRMTQCLSSQVGCTMGCTFCSTAKMGFIRNMTASEILGQIFLAKIYLNDRNYAQPIIKNLVFMGMGEPFLNLKELNQTLHILHDKNGLNFSTRRITISSCGIKKGIQELSKNGLAFLAISLHAPNQLLRSKIMPKAAQWQLHDLIDSLKTYSLKKREKITFEYLLLGGVNDSPSHAQELAKLISQIKSKLNLICYNSSEGEPYLKPTEEAILTFQKILWSKGITAILRKSKGQDIQAACGQLYTSYSLQKNSTIL